MRQVLSSGPHRYSFQTAVSFRCNPGYYLLGTSSISCQGDGTWDRSLPKCLCKDHIFNNIPKTNVILAAPDFFVKLGLIEVFQRDIF